jgi:hypothetical protein
MTDNELLNRLMMLEKETLAKMVVLANNIIKEQGKVSE